MHLADGEDIKFLQSTHPNSNFAAYMSATTELIASAVGLPAEILRLSFNSSYSASRAAIIQAGQKYTQVRTHFISRFVRPVYEVFAYETLKDDVGEEGALYLAKALGSEAVWRSPRLAALDPKVELEAYKLAMEMGLVDADEVALAVYGHRAAGTPKAE
jgi:capsid protein